VGFSIVAAMGLLWMLRSLAAIPGAAMLAWLVGASAAAHPDYLPYFNEFAARKPQAVLIDSDIDWGQDMKRLALRLRELHAPEVHYLSSVYTDLSEVPLPVLRPFDIEHPTHGWHAAHITILKLREHDLHSRKPNSVFWTETIEPTERIGGVLLWNLP
jgi:hypothetical protein